MPVTLTFVMPAGINVQSIARLNLLLENCMGRSLGVFDGNFDHSSLFQPSNDIMLLSCRSPESTSIFLLSNPIHFFSKSFIFKPTSSVALEVSSLWFLSTSSGERDWSGNQLTNHTCEESRAVKYVGGLTIRGRAN
jgi:hypothetical protein